MNEAVGCPTGYRIYSSCLAVSGKSFNIPSRGFSIKPFMREEDLTTRLSNNGGENPETTDYSLYKKLLF